MPKVQRQARTAEIISYFAHVSIRDKRRLLLLLFFPLSTICMSTAVPYYISKVFASLATGKGQPRDYLPYLITFALIGVVSNRIGFGAFMHHQALALENILNDCLTKLLHKSAKFYNNQMTGKLVSDAIDFGQSYTQFSSNIIVSALPFAITLLGGTVVVAVKSPLLAAGLLVVASGVVGMAIRSSKRRLPLRVLRHEAQRKVHGHLADVIVNNQAVKTFAHEDEELSQHRHLMHELTLRRLKDWALVATDGSNRLGLVLILQISFIMLVVQAVRAQPELLATGIFAFTFTITLSNKLFEVSNIVRDVENALTNAAPMIEILTEEPDIQDQPEAVPLKVSQGLVEFQNVNFDYTDAAQPQTVFVNLSLDVQPSQRIGLVGTSGGGKSTLTRLLLRFEDIQGGHILIDGQNIAQVTQASLRQQISYVPQEPLLFHRSIAENISYGKPAASKTEVEEAARLAHAHDFITTLPSGYQTVVGERGVKLSGGQRQRIAIARAILKNAPILVLDEATSALDSESELLIQQALWQLMEGKTALVIAHRLSTIQKLDRIIVLEDGTITEQGTHAQLLKQSGKYASLWTHQSGGFLEE